MTNVCVPSSYIQSTPVSTIEAVDYVPYTPTIEVIVHLPIRLAKDTAIEGKGLGGVFRKTITGLVAYFRFYEPRIVVYLCNKNQQTADFLLKYFNLIIL